jgi:hypothetical protein
MVELEPALKRLLKLCPDITLSPSDIQKLVDGKTNEVVSAYKNQGKPVEIVVEEPEEEFIEEEEVETHINECDDDGCECRY